jgi:hypothetical protein
MCLSRPIWSKLTTKPGSSHTKPDGQAVTIIRNAAGLALLTGYFGALAVTKPLPRRLSPPG